MHVPILASYFHCGATPPNLFFFRTRGHSTIYSIPLFHSFPLHDSSHIYYACPVSLKGTSPNLSFSIHMYQCTQPRSFFSSHLSLLITMVLVCRNRIHCHNTQLLPQHSVKGHWSVVYRHLRGFAPHAVT